MFTNLMKSSLVAMLGMVVVGFAANPAEAQRHGRHQTVHRPAYQPAHQPAYRPGYRPGYATVGRSHYRPVVVERPRYYSTPVYYNYNCNRPVIYTEPVVYREPVVVYSQPSCYRPAPVVYTEPEYYGYPRGGVSVGFNFGHSGHHSYYGGGVGFDWR